MATNLAPTLQLNFAKTKRLDPRITFSRASSGGYHGADGLYRLSAINEPRFDHDPATGVSNGLLIEESRTNLLTYSEQFDNAAWNIADTNVTADAAAAPDGTLTADYVIASNTNAFHTRWKSGVGFTSGVTYTWSCYAKAGAYTFLGLQAGTPATFPARAIFNLSAGTASATFGTASIQAVGGGWYRCAIVATAGAAAATGLNFAVCSTDSYVTYTGDGTSGLYIWGAQLEAGAFPTSYIASTETFTSRASAGSFFGSNGLIQSASTNVARYNYNPLNLTLAPKLLLEEARTNLLTYSEQFDNAAWVKARSTITTNAITAPDGTTAADKLVEMDDASVSATHYIDGPSTTLTAAAHTGSVFCKAGERTRITMYIIDSGGITSGTTTSFDLSAGTVLSGANGIISSVGNGWYRCSVTGTTAAGAGGKIRIILRSESGESYDGDGTSGLYIWGAQLEAGAFPTSYIQTVASQVTRSADISSSAATTRSADVASMAGTNFSSWYNQTEGTFVADWFLRDDKSSVAIYQASDGSSNNLIRLRYSAAGTANDCVVIVGGVTQASLSDVSQLTLNASYRNAMAYKLDDFSRSANGGTVIVDGSGTLPTNNVLHIGSSVSGVDYLNGHISSLAYFNTRVDNTTLKQLSASASNDVAPSLQLNFAKTKRLDPRVTFSRASTGTYFDQAGVLRTTAINEVRFQHDPVTGECRGLLCEEARQNLLTYSQDFDNAAWTKSNTTVSPGTATAIDGTVTGDTLTENTAATEHYIQRTVAATVSAVHTLSVYAKRAAGTRNLRVALYDNASTGNLVYADFDFTALTASTFNIGAGTLAAAAIETCPNGWYRLSLTGIANTSGTTLLARFSMKSGSATSYTGDGASGFYLWGGQLEPGDGATTPIATTSAAVTRAADVISMTGVNFSSWWNAVEGTIVAAYSKLAMPASGSQRLVTVSDGAGNESIRINSSASGAGYQPLWQVVDGGVTQVNLSTAAAVALAARHVTAAAYKVDDFAYTTDGVPVASDTAGTLPTVTQMAIGGPETAVATWNGCIASLTYYPRRLSNATLQGLSST